MKYKPWLRTQAETNRKQSTTTNDCNQFLPFSSNLREIEPQKEFQANRTRKQAEIAMLNSWHNWFQTKTNSIQTPKNIHST